jgi:hypothetical protein
MDISELSPWNDRETNIWLKDAKAWELFTSMIARTLENDPRRYPQQIRAAAAFVILFARPGLWPTRRDAMELENLIALARRQLSQVRQLFAAESRQRPEVTSSPDFRMLMKTLDEEMRCLDARLSEMPLNIPNSPPISWGRFFP